MIKPTGSQACNTHSCLEIKSVGGGSSLHDGYYVAEWGTSWSCNWSTAIVWGGIGCECIEVWRTSGSNHCGTGMPARKAVVDPSTSSHGVVWWDNVNCGHDGCATGHGYQYCPTGNTWGCGPGYQRRNKAVRRAPI